MRRYETIIIIDPDLSDEARMPVLDRVRELIPQFEGTLIAVDEWGAKKLAYAIRKKPRGYYVHTDYCGNGALVSEIERFFRIDDRVLKFMTVLLDKDVDPEKILADLAQEKAAEEERLQATAKPAAPPEAKPAAPPEAKPEAPPEAKSETPQEAETKAETPVEAEAADTPAPEVTEETKTTDSSEEA